MIIISAKQRNAVQYKIVHVHSDLCDTCTMYKVPKVLTDLQ